MERSLDKRRLHRALGRGQHSHQLRREAQGGRGGEEGGGEQGAGGRSRCRWGDQTEEERCEVVVPQSWAADDKNEVVVGLDAPCSDRWADLVGLRGRTVQ